MSRRVFPRVSRESAGKWKRPRARVTNSHFSPGWMMNDRVCVERERKRYSAREMYAYVEEALCIGAEKI